MADLNSRSKQIGHSYLCDEKSVLLYMEEERLEKPTEMSSVRRGAKLKFMIYPWAFNRRFFQSLLLAADC